MLFCNHVQAPCDGLDTENFGYFIFLFPLKAPERSSKTINMCEVTARPNAAAQNETSCSLSKEKLEIIAEFAKKFRVPFEELMDKLKLKDNCYIVPLYWFEEHRNCLIEIFSNSRPEYMKYYLDGRIRAPSETERYFYTAVLGRMWDENPSRTICFIIDYNNQSVGRIAIGALLVDGSKPPEIGYALQEEFAGRGLTSAAVGALIRIITYLVDKGFYVINKITAICRVENLASKKVLLKNNFVLTGDTKVSPDGVRNVFVYDLK